MGAKGARLVLDAIEDSTSLAWLSLSSWCLMVEGNCIGVEGVKYVAESLITNKSIKTLNISKDWI